MDNLKQGDRVEMKGKKEKAGTNGHNRIKHVNGNGEEVAVAVAGASGEPGAPGGGNGKGAAKKKVVSMKTVREDLIELRKPLDKVMACAVEASQHKTSADSIQFVGRSIIGAKDTNGYTIDCAQQTGWTFGLTSLKPIHETWRRDDELASRRQRSASHIGEESNGNGGPALRSENFELAQLAKNVSDGVKLEDLDDKAFDFVLSKLRTRLYVMFDAEPSAKSNTANAACAPDTVLVSIETSHCTNLAAAFSKVVDGGDPSRDMSESEYATEKLVFRNRKMQLRLGDDHFKVLKAHGHDGKFRWGVYSVHDRLENFVRDAGYENPMQYVAGDMTELADMICDGLRELRAMKLFAVVSPTLRVHMVRWLPPSSQNNSQFGGPKSAVIGNVRRVVQSSASERAGYRVSERRLAKLYGITTSYSSVSFVDHFLEKLPSGNTDVARELVASFVSQRFGPIFALTPKKRKELRVWNTRNSWPVGEDEIERHVDAIRANWASAYPVAEEVTKAVRAYMANLDGLDLSDEDDDEVDNGAGSDANPTRQETAVID